MNDRNDLCFCNSGKKKKKCHPDTKSNSVFADLITLMNDIDIKITSNENTSKLKCKKGCSECCSENFAILPIEFIYIMSRIISKDKYLAWKILEQGNSNWETIKKAHSDLCEGIENSDEDIEKTLKADLDFFTKIRIGLPCVFLEDNSCSIYQDRPIVCRYHGVGYITEYPNLSNLSFCNETKDGVQMGLLTNLIEFQDRIEKLGTYQTKDGLMAKERPYPIYYFCKIYHNNHDNLTAKINEFNNFSFEEISEIKLSRYKNRH